MESPAKPLSGIDENLLLDCIHCGLCLSSCPTYLELGAETDSPRGRIYLMRAVSEGRTEIDATLRHHLDLCLDCRACESACPSGVQYGRLIETFRASNQTPNSSTLSAWQRFMLFHVFPNRSWTRWALAPVRLLQRLGADRLIRMLPARLRAMYQMLPRLNRPHGRLAETWPAVGKRRARVALLVGCVADSVFPQTTLATIRVLQHNGCEVWIPPGLGCCGAIHYHSGFAAPARDFAALNCAALSSQDVLRALDAVIVNAAGCGAMLKEYDHLLQGTPEASTAAALASKARDVCEFLIELGLVPPLHRIPIRAVYHDPCHLCHGQQVREQPRKLLEMIPGLKLIPLNESELCCGAAGIYNVTQPEMAERLGERKLANILAADPDAVITGNVGCLMQIGRYLRARRPNAWLAHPIDVLWASYNGQR